MSPGSYSDHSNHAMSLAGMGHYRGHDNLPISDNNVSTTNDALDTGDWELPGEEADIDVSSLEGEKRYKRNEKIPKERKILKERRDNK